MIETKMIYYADFALLNLIFHIAQCTLMECKQRDYDYILLVYFLKKFNFLRFIACLHGMRFVFWPIIQNFGCNIFFIWNLG